MNKIIVRLIALLLVPCLIADPSVAQLARPDAWRAITSSSYSTSVSQSRFAEEALAGRAVPFMRAAYTRTLFGTWSRLGRRLWTEQRGELDFSPNASDEQEIKKGTLLGLFLLLLRENRWVPESDISMELDWSPSRLKNHIQFLIDPLGLARSRQVGGERVYRLLDEARQNAPQIRSILRDLRQQPSLFFNIPFGKLKAFREEKIDPLLGPPGLEHAMRQIEAAARNWHQSGYLESAHYFVEPLEHERKRIQAAFREKTTQPDIGTWKQRASVLIALGDLFDLLRTENIQRATFLHRPHSNYYDFSFFSSLGWITVAMIFRMDSDAPLLRIELDGRAVVGQVRLGVDRLPEGALETLRRRWPHVQISPHRWSESSWFWDVLRMSASPERQNQKTELEKFTRFLAHLKKLLDDAAAIQFPNVGGPGETRGFVGSELLRYISAGLMTVGFVRPSGIEVVLLILSASVILLFFKLLADIVRQRRTSDFQPKPVVWLPARVAAEWTSFERRILQWVQQGDQRRLKSQRLHSARMIIAEGSQKDNWWGRSVEFNAKFNLTLKQYLGDSVNDRIQEIKKLIKQASPRNRWLVQAAVLWDENAIVRAAAVESLSPLAAHDDKIKLFIELAADDPHPLVRDVAQRELKIIPPETFPKSPTKLQMIVVPLAGGTAMMLKHFYSIDHSALAANSMGIDFLGTWIAGSVFALVYGAVGYLRRNAEISDRTLSQLPLRAA